ncbi:MAG TPA: Rv3235 family protein [Egibacteraceae bacterium]|nr:Rv3235 family protein [Egibacteraceae bacterium]
MTRIAVDAPRPRTAASRPAGPAGTHPAGPAGTRPARGPEETGDRLERLVRGFVTLFLEVEAGHRPRRQLAPLMTPMLYARLTDVWLQPGPRATVSSVRLLERSSGRCELLAMVCRGPRCTAVAVALVHQPGRGWVVDDVARPEAGPLPPPPYPVPQERPDDDDLAIPPVAATDADWLREPPRG